MLLSKALSFSLLQLTQLQMSTSDKAAEVPYNKLMSCQGRMNYWIRDNLRPYNLFGELPNLPLPLPRTCKRNKKTATSRNWMDGRWSQYTTTRFWISFSFQPKDVFKSLPRSFQDHQSWKLEMTSFWSKAVVWPVFLLGQYKRSGIDNLLKITQHCLSKPDVVFLAGVTNFCK